ncbi:hypothetical protein PhCBS80983_g03101 [Powellomyces hirtus]|uniref:Uncharacterized protein n=1 Tax=Powellomyces hirtus TaxID=109895 RepID=A0A507E5X5_9FUNG|nr:hypothetical protein PhCBS80983_g03101 [Powellomyces hirtus]
MLHHLLHLRETRATQPNIPLHHSTQQFHQLRLKRDISFEEAGPVNAIEIDAVDARFLLAACADASIRLYDLEEEGRVAAGGGPGDEDEEEGWLCRPIGMLDRGRGHEFSVTGIHWFPTDTGLFTTGSMDGSIKVWDTNVMESACVFDIEQHVYDHDISKIAQTHNLIAAGTEDQNVRLCDMRTGAFTHSLRGHRAAVLAVKWSPKDEFIVASGSADHTVRLWDVRKANACITTLDQYQTADSQPRRSSADMHTATAHSRAVNGLAFSSDGLNLVTTGHDECVRLWDAVTFTNTLTNYGPTIRNRVQHALHPLITPLTACSPPLLFHPSDNRQTVVFDLFTGALIMKLKKHTARVACVAFRQGTQHVFTGGYDREICWWTPQEPS